MLEDRRCWVFDLDGTLTVPVHDFSAIRTMLGLPEGIGILEALRAMPPEQSAPLVERLEEYEYELACRAEVARGAYDLLATLSRRRRRLGILTRNSLRNVDATLRATGLAEFFPTEALMTRDHAELKPSPDGIHVLLGQWSSSAEDSVMVGNHLMDLLAGRAAGSATVLVGDEAEPGWHAHADVVVDELTQLVELV